MAVVDKRSKSIAEYAVRRWLLNQGFVMDCFTLTMDGNRATLKDKNGDTLVLVYDSHTKSVYVQED